MFRELSQGEMADYFEVTTEAPKPIETSYQGYRFRSRLEARYAVLFDALEIDWEYEVQGYDLGDGIFYLPDFWLPHTNGGCWVEIKGAKPTERECLAAQRLAVFTLKDAFIFFGSLRKDKREDDSAYKYFAGDDMGWDFSHRLCVCPACKLAGIAFCGDTDRLLCACNVYAKSGYWDAEFLIEKAYNKALAARFEHGEQG